MSKPMIVDMAMPGKTQVDGMMIVVNEKGSVHTHQRRPGIKQESS